MIKLSRYGTRIRGGHNQGDVVSIFDKSVSKSNRTKLLIRARFWLGHLGYVPRPTGPPVKGAQ